tara:strand:- start:879 stop:1355 length:477 start_codon:yes stop_codon:yes gene_type:complete
MFNCNLCIIAVVFLIANIFTIISCNSDNYKQNFKNLLTKQQNLIYEKITTERTIIYYSGYALGIILSILTIFIMTKIMKIKLATTSLVCIIGAVTFTTNYLYYILYPKSDYMLLHLNDKKQIEGWLDIYKTMQFKFHLGFVFGIIAVIIFSASFNLKK